MKFLKIYALKELPNPTFECLLFLLSCSVASVQNYGQLVDGPRYNT